MIISQQIFQENLVTAIWNFDNEQLMATAKGILKQSVVVGIEILDDKQQVLIKEGQVLNKELKPVIIEQNKETPLSYITLFHYSFDLYHQKEKIGSVTLYSSNEAVFEKVKYSFIIIIINSIIKTISLWLLFIWAFNKFLTQQLDVF